MERDDNSGKTKNEEQSKKTSTSPTASTSGVKLKTMSLNDTKAGMEGLDKDSIDSIITEASKNSKFYEHKLKQQKEVEKKVEEMKAKLAKFSEATLRDSEHEMDKFGEQLEKSRDYSKFIVHIDMDMFYAAVEMRDDATLKDKPMAVGTSKMLCTSNYAARRFGVRAAMPGFIGKKLCPSLVIVHPNFDKYTAVSSQVKKILKEYDSDCIMGSLDEAYLDITPLVQTSERDPEEIVSELRAKIFETTKLTASAGIASNGFLAKLAGDICKPNGQSYIPKNKEAEAKFVNDLPIRKVNGIGGVTELLLKGLGINTCKEIWEKRGILNLLFKPITSQRLIQISKGYQESHQDWAADGGRKSISCDVTLEKGTSDVTIFVDVLEKIAEDLASQLQTKQMKCKSVVLKIKTVEFTVNSRSTNLLNFTNKASDIFSAAKEILEGYVKEAKNKTGGNLTLRLLGIRVCKWEPKKESHDDTDDYNSASDSSHHHNEHHEPPSKQLKIEEAFAKVYNRKFSDKKDNPSTSTSTSTKTTTNTVKNNFDCPACSESFPTESAVEIHLDSCTGLYVSPAVSQQSNDTKNAIGTEAESRNIIINKHNEDVSMEVDIVTNHPVKKFTCPICFKEIQSLVENIEIASSDHVNFCINQESSFTSLNGNSTWKILTTN